jgi:flavin reductase (DIM6/NTAB) family NADH-FMN oxidoreductase RutF
VFHCIKVLNGCQCCRIFLLCFKNAGYIITPAIKHMNNNCCNALDSSLRWNGNIDFLIAEAILHNIYPARRKIMKKSMGAKTMMLPTPVLIVGTYDTAGKPNVMTVAWGGVCCSEPPCINVSLRKATHTYENIIEKKAFTVHIAVEPYLKEADYFGIASGKKVDKFAATGLTPVRAEFVDAPYIKEFPLVFECELLHTTEIGLHTQFIGVIVDVKIDEEMLTADGFPDVEKMKPLAFTPGARDYYSFGKVLGKAFKIGKKIME